ncbi:NAD dependent epimerase dehydratase family protein [Grosmannia clavigera kw1407]|uniref:NAD dependent epimerase dehydratase family protein n=1 Tax=Grosmannia clavigera (strain kw1407 / UAMH 11150) TaxID=655863 RepID=F0XRU6_GROCL|nr:NAD dependent epimerase dehydratase family protein [Grosmannia clavigera kw1407]EFW99565.1 NAD dependent epimerase dehydratase family protein [Grosmannia clavigera kw1407]
MTMCRKSVLVTGASGLLGRQVVEVFEQSNWAVTGTGFSRANGKTLIKVNLENSTEVKSALDEVKPDVVVHCAANRFPDKVENDPEGTRRLNIEASRKLAQLCASRGITLIYISTDYVFPGKPGEAPYEVEAAPAPTNLYGQTKLDGERAVLGVYNEAQQLEKTKKGHAVILRVPVLYGRVEKPAESAINVLMDIVNKVQAEGVTVKMDDWSIRYPTNTEDVARVLKDIATKYTEAVDADLPPVLQFSSEDRFTKYEICRLFAETLGVNIDRLLPDPTGGNTSSIQRPYDCHLSTKALKDLGIDVHTQDFRGWWRWQTKAFRH